MDFVTADSDGPDRVGDFGRSAQFWDTTALVRLRR